MPQRSRRRPPGVEQLDARILLASTPAANPAPLPKLHLIPGEYPSADANRPFTPADLAAYAEAYESSRGGAAYTPQYDFNGTGFIGQNDATPILRGLAAITPAKPLKLTLKLAPGEQIRGHHPSISGAATRLGTVTVIGHTTPNSIVFFDVPSSEGGAGTSANYKFEGGAIATDGQGDFSFTVPLVASSHGGSLTNDEFLVRTPSGQQLIRAFPILRVK